MIAVRGGLVFDRWFWPIIQPLLTRAGTCPATLTQRITPDLGATATSTYADFRLRFP
jgi:hypothetical protein